MLEVNHLTVQCNTIAVLMISDFMLGRYPLDSIFSRTESVDLTCGCNVL